MDRTAGVTWRAGLVCKVLAAGLCMVAFSFTCRADTFLFGNNASGTGDDSIWQIDVTSGDIVTNEFVVRGIGNGRGVIDVNNILYITTASSGNVYAYNTVTQALSTVFTVSGASGLASITYTGTDFWIGDYSGTNQAFLYTPGGTLLKTITLSDCTSFCDGLTFFPVNGGELLSNRFDGAFGLSDYDLYDQNGNLIKADFIDTSNLGSFGCGNTTGIAWDGTDFWVSCIFGPLAEYDANGNFIQVVNINTNGFNNEGQGALIEGLSANFALTTGVPEPTTFYLLGLGLAGLGLLLRKKLASGPTTVA